MKELDGLLGSAGYYLWIIAGSISLSIGVTRHLALKAIHAYRDIRREWKAASKRV